jgi:hypothetical protein
MACSPPPPALQADPRAPRLPRRPAWRPARARRRPRPRRPARRQSRRPQQQRSPTPTPTRPLLARVRPRPATRNQAIRPRATTTTSCCQTVGMLSSRRKLKCRTRSTTCTRTTGLVSRSSIRARQPSTSASAVFRNSELTKRRGNPPLFCVGGGPIVPQRSSRPFVTLSGMDIRPSSGDNDANRPRPVGMGAAIVRERQGLQCP